MFFLIAFLQLSVTMENPTDTKKYSAELYTKVYRGPGCHSSVRASSSYMSGSHRSSLCPMDSSTPTSERVFPSVAGTAGGAAGPNTNRRTLL